MPSSNSPMHVPQAPIPAPVPAGLSGFLSQGLRKILITRTPEDDADPAFRATAVAQEPDSLWLPRGFAGTAGMGLSASGKRVVIVNAGAGRLTRRGLRDLLRDTYRRDLGFDPPEGLGVGDWLEILNAQERSGELELRDGGNKATLQLVRGSIHAMACPYAPGEERLPEAVLLARASERVARLLSANDVQITFTPCAVPPADLHAAGESHMDTLLRGRVRSPFLDRRIAESLARTAAPNLRVLAAGAGEPLTARVRRPIATLIDRIARDSDVVLIDAPPVSPAGPTPMLAGLADAALLVVSAASVRSPALLRAVDALRRAGAATVAVHAMRTHLSLAPAPIR
jgi:hypothetical protein